MQRLGRAAACLFFNVCVDLGIESGVMGLYFSVIAGSQVLASALFGKVIDTHGDRMLRAFAAIAVALSILTLVFYLNRLSFAVALAWASSAVIAP